MRSLDGLADDELLGLARRDPEAFAVFYRRRIGSIVGFFVRRTACHETAADLTAETFAQAYLSLHRYCPTGGTGAGVADGDRPSSTRPLRAGRRSGESGPAAARDATGAGRRRTV
jgi:hypothetical protein